MQNLKTLFSDRNVKSWGVLAFRSVTVDGIARAPVLHASKLIGEFASLGPDPLDKIWYIYCDHLILDAPLEITSDAVVFARTIEIETGGHLVVKGPLDKVDIIAQSIATKGNAAKLTLVSGDAGQTRADIMADGSSGAMVAIIQPNKDLIQKDWSDAKDDISDLVDGLEHGEILHQGLVTSFQLAIMTDKSEPEIAVDQLHWIDTLAASHPATTALAAQSRTQICWLAATLQGTIIVPPLAFTEYSESAVAQITALESQNKVYEKWVSTRTNDANWVKNAKLSVALSGNDAGLSQQLEDRAETAFKNATIALGASSRQMAKLDQNFSHARNDFDAGVKIWKRDQQIKATIDLIKSLVKLGTDIAAIAAGGGEGTAAGAGAKAGEAGEAEQIEGAGEAEQIEGEGEGVEGATGETGETGGAEVKAKKDGMTTSRMKDIGKSMPGIGGDVVDVASKVQKFAQINATANKLHKMAGDTFDQVEKGESESVTFAPLKGLNFVTGGEQVWKALSISIDDMFDRNKSTLDDIEGGPEFCVAFKQLVAGAQAFCSVKLAVAKSQNAMAEAKLRQQAAERALKLTENYSGELQAEQSLVQQFEQAAFGRLLDSKRAVYLELENYQQAIRYFTLDLSLEILPSLTATVPEFAETGGAIAGYKLAFPEGVTAGDLGDTKITFHVEDSMRSADGSLLLPVGLDQPELKLLAQIRLDSIHLELFDADEKKIRVDFMQIIANGTYLDRSIKNEVFKFTGHAAERDMTFDAAGNMNLKGSPYGAYKQVIFKPTPFTLWNLRVDDRDALARISKVEFYFSGEGHLLVPGQPQTYA